MEYLRHFPSSSLVSFMALGPALREALASLQPETVPVSALDLAYAPDTFVYSPTLPLLAHPDDRC